jgi:hypothetical protein
MKWYSSRSRSTSAHWEPTMRLAGMRGSAETARLPRAIESTKTATTMAKVKWEEPKARHPIRLSVVCTAIMAKPPSSATVA